MFVSLDQYMKYSACDCFLVTFLDQRSSKSLAVCLLLIWLSLATVLLFFVDFLCVNFRAEGENLLKFVILIKLDARMSKPLKNNTLPFKIGTNAEGISF